MLHKISSRLKQGGFARSALQVMSGTIMAQGLLILATPLLTRLYAPDDFGALAVFAAIVTMTGSIANLRLETAIPIDHEDRDAVATFKAALLACVLTTALVALLLFFFGDLLVEAVQIQSLKPLLWAIPIGTASMGLYNAISLFGVRKRSYQEVGRSKLAQSVFTVLWQGLHGLLQASPAGLILGQALGQAAGALSFTKSFTRQDRAAVRKVSLGEACAAFWRHRRFALFTTPSILLNNASKMLPAIFLAMLYGPVVAGMFGLAQRVVLAPVRLLGTGVAQVYLGEAPRLAKADRQKMLALFQKTSLHLAWLGVLGMGIIAIPGPWLFALIFGEAYRDAGVQLQILAVMYLAQFVIFPVGQTLSMFGRQDLNLYWDLGNMAITLASFAAGAWLSWSPEGTLGVYSVAMSLNYLLNWLLSRHVILTGTPAGITPSPGKGMDGTGSPS